MNKLSLMGSCQQVVTINFSAIKSHEKPFPFTIVLYSKIRASLNTFWVVDAQFERSSPSRLQFSQNISQRFTVPSGHVIIQDSP